LISGIKELNVIVLAHCILNQSTRWWTHEKPLRDKGVVWKVLETLAKFRIGILQMPCPEFTFCGNPRPPRTKKEYESIPGFKDHCEILAAAVAKDLREIVSLSREPKIRILAIVGVERSPTCGVRKTPISKKSNESFLYAPTKGLFLEILDRKLNDLGMNIRFIGLDLNKPENFVIAIKNL